MRSMSKSRPLSQAPKANKLRIAERKETAMRGEDMYEEGIVTATARGRATVAVAQSDACEECTAKIFCKNTPDEAQSVDVRDPFGVSTGDTVRFVIRGESLFAAAGLLYGIPLLLLLAGVLVGMYAWDPGIMRKELWSFLLGIGATAAYYLAVFLSGLGRGSAGALMPEIVLVHAQGSQTSDSAVPDAPGDAVVHS